MNEEVIQDLDDKFIKQILKNLKILQMKNSIRKQWKTIPVEQIYQNNILKFEDKYHNHMAISNKFTNIISKSSETGLRDQISKSFVYERYDAKMEGTTTENLFDEIRMKISQI